MLWFFQVFHGKIHNRRIYSLAEVSDVCYIGREVLGASTILGCPQEIQVSRNSN